MINSFRDNIYLRTLLPFLSAILLWLSFPPLDLWPLAWISLVPLLIYLELETNRLRRLLFTWLSGYFFFAAGFFWLYHIIWFAPMLLAIYKGLFFLLFAIVYRWLGTSALSTACIWTFFEFVRGSLPILGLPWFLVGYTQHNFTPFIQASDLFGTYFLGFIIVWINSAIARSILKPQSTLSVMKIPAVVIALILIYGIIRLGTIQTFKGPQVLLIQPNIPQDLKIIARMDPQGIYLKHMALTAKAVKAHPGATLVVWPESGFLFPITFKNAMVQNDEYTKKIEQPAKDHKRNFLIGAEVISNKERYNSAILVSHDVGVVDLYSKVQLVPFGEYVPFADLLPFLGQIVKASSDAQYIPDFTAAKEIHVLSTNEITFGSLVCFEGIMPRMVSYSSLKGAKFIINISNDGWFKDSAELDQILNIIKLRAVESRISILRCTNTGISCFISPTGALESSIPGKEREGFLNGSVTLTNTFSLYKITGDLFPVICILFLLARIIKLRPLCDI